MIILLQKNDFSNLTLSISIDRINYFNAIAYCRDQESAKRRLSQHQAGSISNCNKMTIGI